MFHTLIIVTGAALAGLTAAGCATTADRSGAASFRADRLLLTWQRDPTTTMTVQWLGSGWEVPAADDRPLSLSPFEIPYIGDVALDAGPVEWWEDGLRVAFLADSDHQVPDPDLFSADLRLGWNRQGLVVRAEVHSLTAFEQSDTSLLWAGDSIEVFVSDAAGSTNRYQVAAAPGRMPDQPAARHYFYGLKDGPDAGSLSARVASRHADREDGYVIELLLPWANLGLDEVALGQPLGLQFHINDRDNAGSRPRSVRMHQAGNSAFDSDVAYAFILAERAGAPVRVRGTIDTENERVIATFVGTPDLNGKALALYSGNQRIATGRFSLATRGAARAEVALPAPPAGKRWGTIEARLDATPVAVLRAPEWLGQQPPAPAVVTYWMEGSGARRTTVTQVQRVRQWPGTFIQRVELTGLEPDTAYRFQVGNHPDYGFRTMPATLDRPLRIAIGGDTRHNQEWMERVNRVAMVHAPDLIVWGGDLAYADGNEANLYRWREWFDANYNTLIDAQRRITPIVVAIGNHEVQRGYYYSHTDFEPTDDWRARIAPYFYSLFAFPGQPGYNVLDFGDYLSLVILDSAHSNPVEGVQTELLAEVLAARAAVPHLFPVYHVPAYPSHRPFSGRVSATVREQWLPLFDAHAIRLAFENHDHAYKRTPPIRNGAVHPDGVVYLGDGAWGVGTRTVHNPEETWYLERAESVRHVIMLTLSPTHTAIDVFHEDGSQIDSAVIPAR